MLTIDRNGDAIIIMIGKGNSNCINDDINDNDNNNNTNDNNNDTNSCCISFGI